MNPLSLIIGVAIIAFGLFTLVARLRKPAMLGKLGPMQERFGQRLGGVVHFVSYTVIPIVLGVAAVIAGLNGRSLF